MKNVRLLWLFLSICMLLMTTTLSAQKLPDDAVNRTTPNEGAKDINLDAKVNFFFQKALADTKVRDRPTRDSIEWVLIDGRLTVNGSVFPAKQVFDLGRKVFRLEPERPFPPATAVEAKVTYALTSAGKVLDHKEKVLHFTTGYASNNAPPVMDVDTLPANAVVYAWPYHGQKNFYKKEFNANKGILGLSEIYVARIKSLPKDQMPVARVHDKEANADLGDYKTTVSGSNNGVELQWPLPLDKLTGGKTYTVQYGIMVKGADGQPQFKPLLTKPFEFRVSLYDMVIDKLGREHHLVSKTKTERYALDCAKEKFEKEDLEGEKPLIRLSIHTNYLAWTRENEELIQYLWDYQTAKDIKDIGYFYRFKAGDRLRYGYPEGIARIVQTDKECYIEMTYFSRLRDNYNQMQKDAKAFFLKNPTAKKDTPRQAGFDVRDILDKPFPEPPAGLEISGTMTTKLPPQGERTFAILNIKLIRD